jgi:hypothetical protein
VVVAIAIKSSFDTIPLSCCLPTDRELPPCSTSNGLVRTDVDPDLELFERWRAGDSAAGQQLFARHFSDIYAFFR